MICNQECDSSGIHYYLHEIFISNECTSPVYASMDRYLRVDTDGLWVGWGVIP